MVVMTVGRHSYGLLSECDEYLDRSLRAASIWIGVAPDDKRRAMIEAYRLIERQTLSGTPTGIRIVETAQVAAGGSGYVKNEVLTVLGGTFGEAAIVLVKSVASGVVSTIEVLHAGTYTEGSEPASPASTTSSGSGTGCTLTLTFGDQLSHLPSTGLVDAYGNALASDTYPTIAKEAQFELAFAVQQDPSIGEASGTGSNLKSVGAGSARVEFFRPEDDLERFPPQVMELLGPLLAGASATSLGGFRGGGGNESSFDDWPGSYGLTEGY